MSDEGARDRGTPAWVKSRLALVNSDHGWTASPDGAELLDWLCLVAARRARRMNVAVDDRSDVVQEAMASVLGALRRGRGSVFSSTNPAAVLERVVARAVAEADRSVRMAGLGGVPGNGQRWRARYPRRIGGESARQILEQLPNPVFDPDAEIEAAASRTSDWVAERLAVVLTPDAVEAVIYVLHRLASDRVSRATLVRGGHSGLPRDPLLRHLGFSKQDVSALGVWLLGRHDTTHNAPAVLDAALLGDEVDPATVDRWRRVALATGFAVAATGDSRRSA